MEKKVRSRPSLARPQRGHALRVRSQQAGREAAKLWEECALLLEEAAVLLEEVALARGASQQLWEKDHRENRDDNDAEGAEITSSTP